MNTSPTTFETFGKIQHLEEKTRQLEMEIAVLKAQVTKCEVRIGEFDRQLKNATYYLRQLDNGTRV